MHLSAMASSSVILRYHEETKHSELSVRMSAHYLDWDNKPSPFKEYHGLSSTLLPREFPHPEAEALAAIRDVHVSQDTRRRTIDLGVFAELLFFSAGLTRKMKVGSNSYYMRAASATGALYPIELYAVCGQQIPGLAAGVYHFNPYEFALVRLKEGDHRQELAAACGDGCLTSPVSIIFTSLAWRNAWKYEARSYRHWFWDSGVIVANLLGVCASEGIPIKVLLGFVDSEVDHILALKKCEEATVAVVPIGVGQVEAQRKGSQRDAAVKDITATQYEPLSKEEAKYPSIWEANGASSLGSLDLVDRWRQSFRPSKQGRIELSRQPAEFLLPTTVEDITLRPTISLTNTILLRGSTRKFAHEASITFEQLAMVINGSAQDIPLDYLLPKATLIDYYLIANEVKGLTSGSYYFNRETKSLVQLKVGQFRSKSGYLCLEQSLFADANAVLFLMADLDQVISALGDRGYRAAQFEAAVRAGKIYLSSYSLKIGASGSTFYDDAVTEFFFPHAKGKSTMIAVGVGVPAYRCRSGTILPQFQ